MARAESRTLSAEFCNVRFFILLAEFCECTSLSLPGTGLREGGAFRAANEQTEKMHNICLFTNLI